MKSKTNSSHTISSILKGEFISERSTIKLLPFLLMIVVLGLINIRSSFHAERLLKDSIDRQNWINRKTNDMLSAYQLEKDIGLLIHFPH